MDSGIICYNYLANPDSAEYHAIRLERMPGAISGHSLLTSPWNLRYEDWKLGISEFDGK